MAEGKSVGSSGGGAGFFAKRVQKQLCRAQEKVMQKLGKAMETKDEQFEQCSQNLNKQQNDGNRLFKDIKSYFNAVKVMHETSKRLSHSLKDIYESDWHGQEDLSVIVESEDLLWNDFEEKLADQTVRTLENYTSQFPEVKERVAKRGRKLVDYDSSRHHLEALQNAKKRDEAKVAKAEEEFNKAQSVFEDINTELREELPVLFQSRIGCYVTVFQNISNLRDVFYKEMSTLNNELYNVMKKLETQHSDKAFIIKGLHSTSSKKRRSLMISAPIPCNTAFPSDHNTIPLPLQDNKGSDATSLKDHQEEVANETDTVEGQDNTEHEEAAESSESQASLDSTEEKPLASEADRKKSVSGDSDGKAGEESQKHEGREQSSEENSTQLSSQDGTSCTLALDENVESTNPQGSPQPGLDVSENLDTRVCDFSQPEPSPSAAVDCQPVPVPQSLQSSVEKAVPATVTLELREERREEASDSCDSDAEDTDVATSGQTETALPPGFLYKGVAVKGNLTEETGQLQFIEGDVILVLDDEEQKPEGIVRGLKERHWIEHGQLDQSGIFMEKLIWRIESK